jgi:hypothetical protein
MTFDLCSAKESSVAEPVKVRPAELHATASEIDNHADDFAAAHRTAHRRANETVLGSGLSTAALPAMLGAWQTVGTWSAEQFAQHADRYRTAADAFAQADHDGTERIAGIGPAI